MSQTNSLNVDYNYRVVRLFALTTVFWGIIGMAVGVLIAAQLYGPGLNFETLWFTYSCLRPLHTNAVIFAFCTSGLLVTSFYVVSPTSQVRLFAEKLPMSVFRAGLAVIVAAVST